MAKSPSGREFTGRDMALVLVGGFGIVVAVNFFMASLATGGFHGVVVEKIKHALDLAAAIADVVVGHDDALVDCRLDPGHHIADLSVSRSPRRGHVPHDGTPGRGMVVEYVGG